MAEAHQRLCTVLVNLVGAIILSLCGSVVKKFEISSSDIYFGVGVFNFLLSQCFLQYDYESTKPELYKLGWKQIAILILNGILFNGSHCYFYYRGFVRLNYGDFNVIYCSSIILNCVLLEFVQFRKKPSWTTCLSSAMCVLGIVLMAALPTANQKRQKFDFSQLDGLISTFLSGTTCAIFFELVRPHDNIRLSFHWYCFSLGYVIFPFMEALCYGPEVSLCPLSERVLIITVIGFWSCANYCLLFASQNSIPSVSFIIKMVAIVLSYILQLLFLDEPLTFFNAIAVSFVFLGVLLQGVATVIGRKENIVLHTNSDLEDNDAL